MNSTGQSLSTTAIRRRWPLLLAAACLVGCATTPAPVPAPGIPSALDRGVTIGRVLLLPQPSPDDLDALATAGYTTLIDLRTPREIDQRLAQFDQQALAVSLGLEYRNVAVGGSDGYGPAPMQALQAALGAGDGGVVVHCASGARAALVHAAYRMQVDGLSPTDALREVAALGAWPLALEQLSGVPLVVERAPPMPPKSADDD